MILNEIFSNDRNLTNQVSKLLSQTHAALQQCDRPELQQQYETQLQIFDDLMVSQSNGDDVSYELQDIIKDLQSILQQCSYEFHSNEGSSIRHG